MPCALTIITQDEEYLQELTAPLRNAKTLAMMMLAAWRFACLLAVKLVEEVLAERADQPCQWPRCPECGARIENKGREDRQIKGLIGIVRWRRKIGRCPNGCEIGQVVPLDDELGVDWNQRSCDSLKRIGCALAVFVPYEIASGLLSLLTTIAVSPVTIWNWVQEAGINAIDVLDFELFALQEGDPIEPEAMKAYIAQLPLLFGGDGVLVPLRPCGGSPEGKTDWREVKVGIFARLNRYINTKGKSVTRLIRRRLVAVLGDTDEFSIRMELEAKKQDLENAETAVWVSDGGRGFWRIFYDSFADCALGILDFYHAAQNLWKAAAAWLDGRTRAARQWFVRARHQLRHGQVDELIVEMEEILFTDQTLDGDEWTTVCNCYGYLDDHREHIQYSLFKDALNLPIGSGMVESACKWLIQQRFKCVGMRWSREGFNNLLHLRLAWVNGKFDELFGFE